jgi:Tol biopolymer transport system component
MRGAVLILLAVVCVAVLATSAETRSERAPSLTFKLVNMKGERRVLSRHVIDPYTYSLSPDHKELAYIAQPCEGCRDNPVMVAGVRSPRERVLVDTGCPMYGVSWAPNGRQLALDATMGAYCYSAGLWFVNPDGSGLRPSGGKVTGESGGLVWSPDSNYLAGSHDITVFSLATHELRDFGQGWGPSWSPDGSRIAYTHNEVIGVIDLSHGGGPSVSHSPNQWERGHDASWSPDGSRIAFRRWSYASLWVRPSQGGKPRRVGRGLNQLAPYIWSPKGRKIAFVSGQSLWVTGVHGRYGRFLAREYGDVRPLAWSRDGRHILYFVLRR